MKINIVSRKLVKPCTPTPPHLKTHKLSFLDEQAPPINAAVILFYPASNPDPITHLEESLAAVLTRFYPLAGRFIKTDHSVDCSDQGAEFVQAEATGAELAALLAETEAGRLNNLLPRQFYQVDLESGSDPLLSVQITGFPERGGVVIGVSVWHKIFDASSVGTFISAWSNANNPGPKTITIRPNFDSSQLFPHNQGYGPNFGDLGQRGHQRLPIAKKFSFNKEAIAGLRSELRPNSIVSRARVVSAAIARALIVSVDRNKHGSTRACIVGQAVNMRGRTVPPAPEHFCGNFVTLSPTRCIAAAETEKSLGIQELVDPLGDGLERTIADCAEMFSPGGDRYGVITGPTVNLMTELMTGKVNFIMFSDWSKSGLYEADFGWGKPVGTAIGAMPGGNSVVLMDNKEGDGLEAWVHLDPSDMAHFEQDEGIKKLFT